LRHKQAALTTLPIAATVCSCLLAIAVLLLEKQCGVIIANGGDARMTMWSQRSRTRSGVIMERIRTWLLGMARLGWMDIEDRGFGGGESDD